MSDEFSKDDGWMLEFNAEDWRNFDIEVSRKEMKMDAAKWMAGGSVDTPAVTYTINMTFQTAASANNVKIAKADFTMKKPAPVASKHGTKQADSKRSGKPPTGLLH